jgi:ribosome-associated protein
LRAGIRFVISYLRPWKRSFVPAVFTRRIEITSEQLAKTCAELASNKKAEEIIVLDLRDISTFTDFFVICSATSEPHLKAIAGEIETRLKEDHKISATAVDGFPASQWIVLDYMQVVVHVFHRDKREFYSLESLWGDAPRLEWESAAAGTRR